MNIHFALVVTTDLQAEATLEPVLVSVAELELVGGGSLVNFY